MKSCVDEFMLTDLLPFGQLRHLLRDTRQQDHGRYRTVSAQALAMIQG